MTMYTYIVKRTQIYLTEEVDEMLAELSRASGLTKSQLIREAIEKVYLEQPSRSRISRALTASSGTWKRRESGETYIERLRTGRLARLHAADSAT